jgi:hypothetical protein
MKLDLRFSNKESSKPFSFFVEGKKSNFWRDFEQNFHKVSVKPTDLNFLKLFLIERDLEEYSLKDMETIDHFMQGFYQCKLKKNATKHFLKWVDKQGKEKVKP